ncbi:MAG: hypothetical protein Q9220_003867 [cf. Caloplaca sp. 1 TL-2023]
MASFVYNSSDGWDRFAGMVRDRGSKRAGAETCYVEILEWPNDDVDSTEDQKQHPLLSITVPALLARSDAKLRIIFAPLDIPVPSAFSGLQALFAHLRIPNEFIAERVHSVTHAFGCQQESNNEYVCWLHSLCKNTYLVRDNTGIPLIQDPRGQRLSQDDGTWRRSGIFLRWKQLDGLGRHDDAMVQMVIFSPHISLRRNLECLAARSDWAQALQDPFCLLVVVLDDLFRQVDDAIINVLGVLRVVEHTVLKAAQTGASGASFDFVALHNIGKHIIHLKESSSAAQLVATEISKQHRHIMAQFMPSGEAILMQGVQDLLQHKLTLFEGCQLRVQSMDNRAQNMTNLAFNTVNQQDSQTMKSDSQSMKVIAIVTMLFLPAATVGSVCGSSFFDFDSDNHKLLVSVDFKYFWAATLPMTIIVFCVYALWRQLKGNGFNSVKRYRQHRKEV